jgi:hypothetical protein
MKSLAYTLNRDTFDTRHFVIVGYFLGFRPFSFVLSLDVIIHTCYLYVSTIFCVYFFFYNL